MKNKERVMVFGGAGFIGKHVVAKLLKEGYDVSIFDQKKIEESFNKEIKFISGSTLDQKKVEESLKKIDIIYNFSGIADIEECIEKPIEAIKNNILGNAIILESCKKNKIKRIVFASSLYAHGSSGGIYSSTKKACESIIKDYYKYYGLKYTILQYGTVYGYGAPKTNSVYRYLKQAITSREINYLGDGNESREYIHVNDAANLSVKVLDKKYENQSIIITGQHPIRVKDLFEMINEILNGVKINYNIKASKAKKESHYKITPYSYYEEIPKKIINENYIELGKGMIEILKEINKEDKTSYSKKKDIRKFCFPDEEKNIGIDFDGVIHNNDKGFHDGTIYGNPLPETKKALSNLSKKYNLIIYTAKAREDRPLINGKTGKQLIWEWLKKNNLDKYIKEVTSEKPRAKIYIDDRAIPFKNWKQTFDEIEKQKK
ncbi:MAG: NAD(P)-dependent oxidoreductase [Candidatus Pacearchaeota archaeon]|jgi:UDP-glucose 4-epimerase